MADVSITYTTRQKLRKRLSGEDLSGSGFNACVSIFAGLYGVDPFIIDFDVNSRNFYQSNVSVELIEAMSVATEDNTLFLYVTSSQVNNRTKFRTFSGLIQSSIDLNLEFPDIIASNLFEATTDMAHDAMVKTFNDPTLKDWWQGNGMVYNYDISCRRGPIQPAGNRFRQKLNFNLSCEIDK